MPLTYDNPQCNQFVADMEDAGFEVEHYRGRNFWTGPAVRGEMQDVARATKVRIQTDSMGLGVICYPVARGKLLSAD